MVPTLEPLFESRELDERLRVKARELFFTSSPAPGGRPPPPSQQPAVPAPSDSFSPSMTPEFTKEGSDEPPRIRKTQSPTPADRVPTSSSSPSPSPSDLAGDPDADSFLYEDGMVPQGLSNPLLPPQGLLAQQGTPSVEFTDKLSSVVVALQDSLEKFTRTMSRESFQASSAHLTNLISQCLVRA